MTTMNLVLRTASVSQNSHCCTAHALQRREHQHVFYTLEWVIELISLLLRALNQYLPGCAVWIPDVENGLLKLRQAILSD